MLRMILVALMLLAPAAARAEWHEARSRNFIVYSDGSERDAREFAAKLERFHFVLRTFYRVTAPPAAVPLRVFLLQSTNDVATMAGAQGSSVAGYYVSDARGLMLVGTRSQVTRRSQDVRTARYESELNSENILLHEYAHHFMYQYFPAAYPTWYSEGFAEFWGATRFLPNDVVDVGLPANHRFSTFRDLGWLPVQRLLSTYNYSQLAAEDLFLLYAEGWLVMRYVFEQPERRRQLDNYIALINRGATYADAARQAFPDLDRFNSELYEYAGTGRFNYIRLPFRAIDIGPIALRVPGPGEQALMRHEIRLSQGIPNREAAAFAREVRDIAGRHPDDPFALRVLMEAEWLAGDRPAALAAADRLLRVEPDHARALTVKGRVQLAGLRSAGTAAGAPDLAATRALFARARRLAPNDPIVLEAYYDSHAVQGTPPPEEVQNALYAAMELAPSDGDLRYKLAKDFEMRDMIADAIAIIRPEALSTPHRGNESEGERRRREAREDRNREAGTQRRETAREMLIRLEQRLGRPSQS